MLSKWLNQLSNQFCVKFFLVLSSVSVITQAGDQAARPANVREAIGSNPGSSSDDPKSISSRFFSFVDRHPVAISVGAAVVVGAGVLVAKERGMRLREGAGPRAVPGLMTVFRSHLTPYLAGPLSGFATRLIMPKSVSRLEQEVDELDRAVQGAAIQVIELHGVAQAQGEVLNRAGATVQALKLQRVPAVQDGLRGNKAAIEGLGELLQFDHKLTITELAHLTERLNGLGQTLDAHSRERQILGRGITLNGDLLMQLSGISQGNSDRSKELFDHIKHARSLLPPIGYMQGDTGAS